MVKRFKQFLRDEAGQDLVEYTLMTSFVVLGLAGIVVVSGGSLLGVWLNTPLAVANISTK